MLVLRNPPRRVVDCSREDCVAVTLYKPIEALRKYKCHKIQLHTTINENATTILNPNRINIAPWSHDQKLYSQTCKFELGLHLRPAYLHYTRKKCMTQKYVFHGEIRRSISDTFSQKSIGFSESIGIGRHEDNQD